MLNLETASNLLDLGVQMLLRTAGLGAKVRMLLCGLYVVFC